MANIVFSPQGYLDINTDSTDLPEKADKTVVMSDALRICKNLNLDRAGMAITRKGSTKMNSNALGGNFNEIIEYNGSRYEIVSGNIYKNESLTYPSSASKIRNRSNVSSILYNPYNSINKTWYFCNGYDNKKYDFAANTLYNWGITAPVLAPTVIKSVSSVVDFTWERDENYAKGYYSKIAGYQVTGRSQTFVWEQTTNRQSSYADTNNPDFVFEPAWVKNADQYDTYKVCYTYLRKTGNTILVESNPSPITYSNILNGAVITWPTAILDPQITHVRIYRTTAGMGDFYYDSETPVASGYAVISKTDDELGTLIETDHDAPPKGNILAGPTYNGIIFMAYQNLLYFSKANRPDYFPYDNYIEVGTPDKYIKAMAVLAGELYVATETEIYQITGTDPSTFFPVPMAASVGTVSKNCFLPMKGVGIWHLAKDGLYLFTGSQDMKVSYKSFDIMFHDETVGSIPYVNKDNISNSFLVFFKNKLYFGYPGEDNIYPSDMIVIEMEVTALTGITGKIVHYNLPFEIVKTCIDNTNKMFFVGDTDGYIWKLEDENSDTDDGESIGWEIQSKDFNQFPFMWPREARYDLDILPGATAFGNIKLDDTIKKTHNITESRNTIKRLIGAVTGKRLAINLKGTGKVKIHGVVIA